VVATRKFTVTAVAVAVAAVGVAAFALTGANGGEGAPALRASSASGTVQLGNSRDGQAILGADNLTPGHSAEGTVTISNTGDAPGATRLEPTDLLDIAGPAGAVLSQRLILEVADTAGNTLYRGALAAMPTLDAGTFAPGEHRTYRFAATLPLDAGNAYQSASAGVGFRWTMTGGGEAAAPAPAPGPGPVVTTPSTGPKRLTVLVRRTRIGRTLSRRRIRLAVVCSRPCRASISGTARWGKGRHRVRKVKRVTRRLPARATTVRIVVPRQARRKKRFQARVTVAAVAADGVRAAVTRTFRLKKPRFQVRLEQRRRR